MGQLDTIYARHHIISYHEFDSIRLRAEYFERLETAIDCRYGISERSKYLFDKIDKRRLINLREATDEALSSLSILFSNILDEALYACSIFLKSPKYLTF